MAEKSWRHVNNERVAKLLDALACASANLQQAARFAADITNDHPQAANTKEWCLDVVPQIETEAQTVRQLLV